MPRRHSSRRNTRRPTKPIVWLGLFLLFFPVVFFNKEFFWLFLIFLHPYPDPALGRALSVTCFSLCLGFLPVLILWLLVVGGQAIVPVNSLNERIRTAWHLFLYMLNRHGVATAVRDGVIQSVREPTIGPPGLLLIDFNSAVVVEENIQAPGLLTTFSTIWRRILISLRLMDPPETPRVFGPGLAFLRPGAYIHSVVDLRRQFRIRTKVSAYTRDGIEVATNVWSLFRVGYERAIMPLNFTLADRKDPSSLQLIDLSETKDGRVMVRRITSDFLAEVDPDDLKQIRATLSDPAVIADSFRFNLRPQGAQIPTFNARNTFSAAFSDALDEDGQVIPWHDLPAKVATDFYRQLLLEFNYDQLYGTVEQQMALEQDLLEEQAFQTFRIRRILTTRVRNNGMLFFRLVLPARRPLKEGETYSPNELVTSQMFPLTASKILRNAGITIIANGFGDLVPVSDTVYKQRLDTWRSRWYAETKDVESSHDIETIQQATRARMQTQDDLVRRLRQILENTTAEPSAAALQVYMELESLASDPMTRRLLPQETVMLMRVLHDWANPNGDRGLLMDGRGRS